MKKWSYPVPCLPPASSFFFPPFRLCSADTSRVFPVFIALAQPTGCLPSPQPTTRPFPSRNARVTPSTSISVESNKIRRKLMSDVTDLTRRLPRLDVSEKEPGSRRKLPPRRREERHQGRRDSRSIVRIKPIWICQSEPLFLRRWYLSS